MVTSNTILDLYLRNSNVKYSSRARLRINKIAQNYRTFKKLYSMRYFIIGLCLFIFVLKVKGIDWFWRKETVAPLDMNLFDRELVELAEELDRLKYHDDALTKYLEVIPHSVQELKKHFNKKVKS